MAKQRRWRRPAEPDAIAAAKRARARANEDAQMRAEGIDPTIARWGDDEISAARQRELEAKGVEVKLDHRRRMLRAHKVDIWEELHARRDHRTKERRLSDEQLAAVRRLQEVMARRAGLGGRNEAKTYADARTDEPLRDPCLVSDDMVAAAREMDLTLRLAGPPSSRLLTALLWPAVLCEPYEWREIVAKITGETRAEAQTAPLRIAAQALVDVQEEVAAIHGRAAQGRRERRDPQGLAAARTHPVLATVAAR